MTPEERAEKVVLFPSKATTALIRSRVADAIREAVLAERNACTCIACNAALEGFALGDSGQVDIANRIAAAIRARGEA